jgi:hypothetical protein
MIGKHIDKSFNLLSSLLTHKEGHMLSWIEKCITGLKILLIDLIAREVVVCNSAWWWNVPGGAHKARAV